MIRRAVVAIAFCAVALTPMFTLAQSFPKFTNYVVDAAKVLPEDTERQINAELKDFQKRMKYQVAVALVESIGNQSIEDYSNDLFEEWGVGNEKEDDGVLLAFAMEERDVRIEVGFGAEGELTDLESGRIIRNVIVPRMQRGDVADAVLEGTHGIRQALGDDQVDTPVEIVQEPQDEPSGTGIPSFLFLLPLFFLFNGIGRRGRRRRGWITPILWGGGLGSGGFGGRGGGGGFGGGGFGGGGGGGSGGGGASGGW